MDVVKVEVTAEIRAYVEKDADQASIDPNSLLLTRLFKTLLDGTGSNQCNQVYTKTDTIIAAATNTIDLVTGPTDAFGDQIVFTKIKGFGFINKATNASILRIGGGTDGAGTTAFDTWISSTAADGSEVLIVNPGGCVLIMDPGANGYAVSAGSDIFGIEEMSTLAGAYEVGFFGIV